MEIGAIRKRDVKLPPLPALDGLRAVAILIVMLSHTGLGDLVPGGFGVTIFFFLSGYLITSILAIEAASTGRVNLKAFYFKRTLRIIPPMFLTIALVAALSVYGVTGREVRPVGILSDFAFLTNYAPSFGIQGGVVIPLWSLDVEEHYYILFSTLFAFSFTKMSGNRAVAICAALAVVPLVIRIGIAASSADLGNVFYWTHTRLDSILWGAILALWQNPAIDRNAWKPKLWHFVAAIFSLGVCLVIRNEIFRETIRYTIQGAALLVIFSYLLQDRSIMARILGSTPLRGIALISYTLYLAHMPALAIAENSRWRFPILTGVTMAFAYSIVMWFVIERPLIRLRRSHH